MEHSFRTDLTELDLEWIDGMDCWVLQIHGDDDYYTDGDDFIRFAGYAPGRLEALCFLSVWGTEAANVCVLINITAEQWWWAVKAYDKLKHKKAAMT